MADALEQAALSGALFRERSHSPARSLSPDHEPNTDDELGSDLDADDGDDDAAATSSRRNRLSTNSAAPLLPPPEHDGPQTGVKGVIADRDASERAARASAAQARTAQAAGQASRIIIASTIEEEAQMRLEEMRLKEEREDADAKARWRRERRAEIELARRAEEAQLDSMGDLGAGQRAKRGGLKEIGQEGFVVAVEQRGWVIVLIYEPEIARCQALVASLLHLAMNMPPSSRLSAPVALYRARATSLRFSLLSTPPARKGAQGADGQEEDESRPDPDVLPTILAYKDGELEKTWIRADWDITEDGVEGLLQRAGILPKQTGGVDAGDSDDG